MRRAARAMAGDAQKPSFPVSSTLRDSINRLARFHRDKPLNKLTPSSFCHRVICLFACLLIVFTTSAQAQRLTVPDKQQTISDAVEAAKKNGNPVIELHTNLGKLQLELYPEKSPKSVENFLSYVNKGYYDATVFHRVIEGFMIQGGGLDLRLEPKPTSDPVLNEADNGLSNQKFTVSMARTSDPHSATAQFFINTANNPFLDHKGSG